MQSFERSIQTQNLEQRLRSINERGAMFSAASVASMLGT